MTRESNESNYRGGRGAQCW